MKFLISMNLIMMMKRNLLITLHRVTKNRASQMKMMLTGVGDNQTPLKIKRRKSNKRRLSGLLSTNRLKYQTNKCKKKSLGNSIAKLKKCKKKGRALIRRKKLGGNLRKKRRMTHKII